MEQVTAEMIERGRGAQPTRGLSRRKMQFQVSATRDKLASHNGESLAYDIEMLRIFSTSQIKVLPAIATFVIVVALSTYPTLSPVVIGAWCLFQLASIGLIYGFAYVFQRSCDKLTSVSHWQNRFLLAETVQGVAWSILIWQLLALNQPSSTVFVLLVTITVAAITGMTSASLPFSVFATFMPMIAAIMVFRPPDESLRALVQPTLAVAGLVYFVFVARRLHATTLNTVAFRAEKDALIAELEQAKANSDEARRRSEEANLAKSRFLATMSHELRTPLNAILGFSEVMKNEMMGPHTVKAYREYSADVHASGHHLLMLINEILDLSRVEAGRYDLHEESVSLPFVVEECRHLLALRAKNKGLTVIDVIEDTLPKIWADERALRQITLNLLSNAIKFTPKSGQITIKVGWTASGGQYLSIKDTGPGIPEDEIPIVMSSFGRGSLAQKHAEEGTGLGLPIVKGLVELHGGVFTLKSVIREGTEVRVIFPAERVMDTLPPIREEDRKAKTRYPVYGAA